jgi:acylphosphatase
MLRRYSFNRPFVRVPMPEAKKAIRDAGILETKRLERQTIDPSMTDQSRKSISSTPSDRMERLSARITGRVQGVGFRHFTTQRAQSLGCTGWVRNETDGSVRLEAEGPRSALDDLLDAVHEGPRSARVEDVSATFKDASGNFERFRVRR